MTPLLPPPSTPSIESIEGVFIGAGRPGNSNPNIHIHFNGCWKPDHPLHMFRRGPVTEWVVHRRDGGIMLRCALTPKSEPHMTVVVDIALPSPYISHDAEVTDV